MAEIGFWPTDISLSFNHWGLSMFLTLVIKQLPKARHPWPFSFLILTLKDCFDLDLIFFSLIAFNLPKPEAARSLAIPLIPRQSGLFGVIDKSIVFVFDFGK